MQNVNHCRLDWRTNKSRPKIQGWNVFRQGGIMMLFHHNRYHIYGLGLLLLCVLFSCLGCDSSDCPTQSKACGIRPGRYQYSFYKSLENDPATFPDGTEVLTYAGTTQVGDTSDGFVFSGGDFNAWEIQVTCIDADSAFLEITLNNKNEDEEVVELAKSLAKKLG